MTNPWNPMPTYLAMDAKQMRECRLEVARRLGWRAIRIPNPTTEPNVWVGYNENLGPAEVRVPFYASPMHGLTLMQNAKSSFYSVSMKTYREAVEHDRRTVIHGWVCEIEMDYPDIPTPTAERVSGLCKDEDLHIAVCGAILDLPAELFTPRFGYPKSALKDHA